MDELILITKTQLKKLLKEAMEEVLSENVTKETVVKFGNARKAGKRFGVSATTIRGWAKKGHIKKYGVGERLVHYCFEEIEGYIRKNS